MAKFLDNNGVSVMWDLIKSHVSTEGSKKQDVLVSGTSIKTLNGESLLGSGNITLDLTLYKVVESLPTENIDVNKIYLVKSTESGENNVYIEYMYVNSAWEKIGEFKSDIDLTPYAKTADVNDALELKADKSDTYTKQEVDDKVTASGTFSTADRTKLDGIETGAEVNIIETVKVDGTALSVTDKTVNIDLSGKVDKETGKGLSTNDYTTVEKTKLAAIEEGANKTIVDSAMSSTSTNPVENKVIYTELAGKQAVLTAGDNITIDGTTISAKDTTYSNASADTAGLMSATDKAKLDAIAEGATADVALTEAEIREICV